MEIDVNNDKLYEWKDIESKNGYVWWTLLDIVKDKVK